MKQLMVIALALSGCSSPEAGVQKSKVNVIKAGAWCDHMPIVDPVKGATKYIQLDGAFDEDMHGQEIDIVITVTTSGGYKKTSHAHCVIEKTQ